MSYKGPRPGSGWGPLETAGYTTPRNPSPLPSPLLKGRGGNLGSSGCSPFCELLCDVVTKQPCNHAPAMIRVLIRAIPTIGTGRATTIGEIEIHPSRQLKFFTAPQGVDVHASLHRPAPFREHIWKRTELDGFDPSVHGPYDMVYQILRNTVGGRTLDPGTIRNDPSEPAAAHWWHVKKLDQAPYL